MQLSEEAAARAGMWGVPGVLRSLRTWLMAGRSRAGYLQGTGSSGHPEVCPRHHLQPWKLMERDWSSLERVQKYLSIKSKYESPSTAHIANAL